MGALEFKHDPGELDRIISIEEPTRSQGDAGGIENTWSEVIEAWAAVNWETTGEKEGVEQGRETSVGNVNFTIRNNGTQIGANMRVKYKSEYYDIIHVAEDGRYNYLKIYTNKIEKQSWQA